MRTVSQMFAGLLFLAAARAAVFPPVELAGDAAMSGNALRLTPARPRMVGAAWLDQKQQVATGFETNFDFRLTHQGGGGADGFAFVLQNSGPRAIAGRGSAGGFAMGDGHGDPHAPAIPSSIAIFFDTYQNQDSGDPSGNYVAICSTGRPENMKWPPARLAVVPRLHVKMKDHQPHAVRITFKPPILTVSLDGAEVLSAPVDLSLVAGATGEAYAGFTASTGDGYQDHDILSWSFTPGPPKSDISTSISFSDFACLPDRNLCTPDRAIITKTGDSAYHVILPANETASITARSAAISDAHGTVCLNTTDCGDAYRLLQSETNDGKIVFSIRGATAAAQGFFEFDVETRR